jgi:DNA transformation protein and related proteins
MSQLQQLPNLGKVLAKKLEQVGITTEQQLIETGSEKAFLLVRSVDPTACINHLYAIEGAIHGIRWHSLSKGRKVELKSYFDNI